MGYTGLQSMPIGKRRESVIIIAFNINSLQRVVGGDDYTTAQRSDRLTGMKILDIEERTSNIKYKMTAGTSTYERENVYQHYAILRR